MLLKIVYPDDIFTGSSGDPGPTYVVALRDALKAYAGQEADRDGLAELYELADHVAFDTGLKRILTGKRLHDLADQWKAERERNIRTDWRKCPNCSVDWPHPSETSSFVCPSCRAAAILERAKALLAEIESEARKQIANPNSNASQMVVAEAIGETCRRIANALDNTQ